MILTLSAVVVDSAQTPDGRSHIFGPAQRQHLVAVDLIQPGPQALESHVTNELIERFDLDYTPHSPYKKSKS